MHENARFGLETLSRDAYNLPTLNTPNDPNEATALRPTASPRPRFEPRFTPGVMLSDRYRIVALLGTGGMGEVYRADDTRLGQPVALKFLPHAMRDDPARVERLYSEVRLGRQVSHPNVCRLYDIGEWEGNHFLAMEYVDGEDLSSLLRRIGKLPSEKALEIVREICAGIAAAHSVGIIHRDLKPANIMLDGRGHVRVTDFGLAVVAEDLLARREVAGTPPYMAPEQLTGGVVSHKSDLYALGLILYEIFTGRRLFEDAHAANIDSRRSALRTLTSSGISRDLDPTIQRVIVRCLEEDPHARPASIHSVIAALPGGDPLQAAMDAGETPSPQMVAAAGAVGDLRPAVAWPVLIIALLAFAGVLALFPRTALNRIVPLPKPPEALIERAKAILAASGYADTARDSAHYIQTDDDFLARFSRSEVSIDEQRSLGSIRPSLLVFGYRDSTAPLVASGEQGKVTDLDPPVTEPGMRHLVLDPQGRLLRFVAVPPERTTSSAATNKPVDWSPFFEFAGGDIEGLKPLDATWSSPIDADEKMLWEGFFRGSPERKIRIEAGSFDGAPVWFRITGPWSQPRSAGTSPRYGPILSSVGEIVFQTTSAAVVIFAIVIARRNVKRNRGDKRTATRLAFAMLGVLVAGHLLRMDHVLNANEELQLIARGVGGALLVAAQVWVFYLALEPLVRRRWPHLLISWSRLFAGRFRDPMIGRDVLIGTCGGILVHLNFSAMIVAPNLLGEPMLSPVARWASPMLGLRHVIYSWVNTLGRTVPLALFVVLMLVLALIVLRRRPLAIAATWIVLVMTSLSGDPLKLSLPFVALAATIYLFITLRFGVLAAAVTLFVYGVIDAAPFTLDPGSWFFSRSMVCLALIAAMLLYGFRAALGEKSPFSLQVLDEA